MRIFVLNFHRHRRVFSMIKMLSLFLVIVLAFGLIANAHVSSDDYASAMAEENEKRVIIIDAGHGGEDPGAVGVNGALEKNLNMESALEVGSILSEEGYAVIYTITEDKLLYRR